MMSEDCNARRLMVLASVQSSAGYDGISPWSALKEHCDLVLDLLVDRQSVQLAEDRGYMVSSISILDEVGSSVLDGLQTTYPDDPGQMHTFMRFPADRK